MTDSPQQSRGALGPITSVERVTRIDALRGFALAGVLLANLVDFSGYVFLGPEARAALTAAAAAPLVELGIEVFVNEKFITLFSLLFGLGFAIQLGRAEARGADVVPTYVRRLLVLLLFGLAHKFLLWGGDILTVYAVLGFGLLFARQWSGRRLVVVGLILAVATMPGFLLGKVLSGSSPGPPPEPILTGLTRSWTDGSYLEVLHANARFEIWRFADHGLTYVTYFGLFLLGLWVGRTGVLEHPERHHRLLRRLCGWGLAVAVLGTGASVVGMGLVASAGPPSPEIMVQWWVPLGVLRGVTVMAMAAAYASAFTLLYERARWRARLDVFTPVGRMALTNYLMQSVLGVWLFYGYMPGPGWSGRVGPLLCLPIFLAIFSAQIVFSRWWLARYRFGPAEWLWRSLTYARLQPMRIGIPAPALSAPASSAPSSRVAE